MNFLRTSTAESGYLLRLAQEAGQKSRSWILLQTLDFTPLSEMAKALSALAQVAKEVAEANGCVLDERSVGGLDDAFPDGTDHEPGHIASLRDYTYTDGLADVERLRWHFDLLLQGRRVTAILPMSGGLVRINESLIGREVARAELLENIRRGPVMLLGPRRNGKTSLLQWLVDEPAEGWAAIYIDLERVPDPTSLAVEIGCAFKKHPDFQSRIDLAELHAAVPETPVKEIEWRNTLYKQIGDGWADFIRRLIQSAGENPAPLLLLDELGEFIDHIQRDEAIFQPFLGVVREFLSASGSHRIVVTGSRSMEFLIEKLGIVDAFRNFRRFPLPDFEPGSARRLFEERLRARGIRPSRSVTDKALNLVGHQIPFFIQLLADALPSELSGDFSDPSILEGAFREALLGHAGQAYFNDLERRMRFYDNFTQRRAGQLILRLIAERGKVNEDELRLRYEQKQLGNTEQYQNLMALLEEYFFLEKQENDWQYRAPVLQAYALRYFPPSRF